MNVKPSKQPVVFNMTSDQCVWAGAGVIGPTACINAFNCLDCPVDRKMQNRVKQRRLAQGPGRGIPPAMKDTLERSPEDPQCRHMLSGRVAAKYCTQGFDCPSCNFQQLMEDEHVNARISPIPSDIVAGFEMAEQYYFHPNHVWGRVEYGGRVRIGLDDFATRLLGAADRVRLPELGTRLKRGRRAIGIARDRFRTDLVSPIQGVVVSRNPGVLKQGGLVNESPYEDGWLMVLEPLRLRADLKKLLFGKKSTDWMEAESSRLAGMLSDEPEYRLAATGGRAVRDIFGRLPASEWDRMAETFLKPV